MPLKRMCCRLALTWLIAAGMIVIVVATANASPLPTSAFADAADTTGQADTAGKRFHDLYTREWQWRQRQFAGADDENGPAQDAGHLPKVDAAAQAMRETYWADVLTTLDAIPRGQLSGEDQVNYDVYRQQIQVLLSDQRFKTWQMPFNSDSGFWSDLGFTARATFTNSKSYRDYLGKLRDIPRYFAEETANMRLGLARGFSQPKIIPQGRTASISEIIAAGGEKNLFYTPFLQMPATIPAAE